LGRQPDLVGGGLIRSAGGWAAVQCLRKAGLSQKSDERILGDGDFVDAVLNNVADRLKIAGPTVSVAVKKGHKIVSDEGLVLSDVLNIRI